MTLAQNVDLLLRDFGVPRNRYSHGSRTVRSPLNGEIIANVEDASPIASRKLSCVEASVPGMARACAAPWRTRATARRGIARRQARAWPAGHARGRKNPVRRPRRSAGDDRHLRFRGRSFAPALRPHHRVRTPASSHDGAMASARPRRRHHGFQFSRRGVGVEHRARAGVRQPVIWKPSEKTPLTALAAQALSSAPRQDVDSSPAGLSTAGHRRTRRRRTLVNDRAHTAGVGDRFDRHGPNGGARGGATFGRAILELGGNNATIVARPRNSIWRCGPSYSPPSARPASAAPRLRRLFVHRTDYDAVHRRLKQAYRSLRSAIRLRTDDACRPADRQGGIRRQCKTRLAAARRRRNDHGGERFARAAFPAAYYVKPALVEMPAQTTRSGTRPSRRFSM